MVKLGLCVTWWGIKLMQGGVTNCDLDSSLRVGSVATLTRRAQITLTRALNTQNIPEVKAAEVFVEIFPVWA